MNQSSSLPGITGSPNILRASGNVDASKPFTELYLEDGSIVRLDTRHLLQTDAAVEDVRPASVTETSEVIPLVEERLVLGKRVVQTGKVVLEKTVQEYEHQLDEPLALRTYDIERKVLNQPVDHTPSVRHEGETTIYPIVEERLILTKQLILKEEVYVKLRDDVRVDTQVVTLKREHLTVRRESTEPERP